MGCSSSIEATKGGQQPASRAAGRAATTNDALGAIDAGLVAAVDRLRQCDVAQLNATAELLDRMMAASRNCKVSKKNCASLCKLALSAGVALGLWLDSQEAASTDAGALQPLFKTVNEALKGALSVLEHYSGSAWLAHTTRLAASAQAGSGAPGPFVQEFKSARDALLKALTTLAKEAMCGAMMEMVKGPLKQQLEGDGLHADMEEAVAAVEKAAGGKPFSQALQGMRGQAAGDDSSALLSEAARAFDITPGLLGGLLDTLTDTLTDVVAPAAAELASVAEGVLDVVDSVLDACANLPMGVGAALKLVQVVLKRAQGVQVNRRACGQLQSLVEGVGETLARYVQRASEQQRKDLEGALTMLSAHLKEADSLFERFGAGSWLRNFLQTNLATKQLADVHARIHDGMVHLNMAIGLQLSLAAGGNKVQPAVGSVYDAQDDLRAAEKAVIDLAGGEANGVRSAAEAVKVLQSRGQQGVSEVARCFGVAESVMLSELDGIKDMLREVTNIVQGVDSKVDKVQVTLEQIKAENENFLVPTNLAAFLRVFWKEHVGLAKPSPWKALKRLVRSAFDEDVEWCGDSLKGVLLPPAAAPSSQSAPLDPADVFLDMAVLPLLDVDGDQQITVQELYVFQVDCQRIAKRRSPPPQLDSLGGMLRVVAESKQPSPPQQTQQQGDGTAASSGTVASTTEQQPSTTAADPQQANVLTDAELASLPPGIAAVVEDGTACKASYTLADLLQDYLDGSREWMYDKLLTWLAAMMQPHASSSSSQQHVFLLLAEAGMGKSVFTASLVRFKLPQVKGCVVAQHFFRVGQRRAQGRSMIVSLAAQLVKGLPGMRDTLQASLDKQAAESKGALEGEWLAQLPMSQAFEWLLEAPLNYLEQKQQSGAGTRTLPTVLLVLDALDEADSDGAGWEPVVQMLAARFRRLPPWVQLFCTGRPEVQALFEGWRQEEINPKDMHNSNDLQALIERSLASQRFVADADRAAAAAVLLRKSEGRFIYNKYAFKTLQARLDAAAAAPSITTPAAVWTMAELETFPDGLSGMYTHELGRVAGALESEGRTELLALLRGGLLPVLAVMQEPLTTQELVMLLGDRSTTGGGGGGAAEQNVELLLSLIATLYPRRTGAADGLARVAPYHKSVRDFLLDAPPNAAPHKWHVDEAAAHASVAQALACACGVEPGRGAREQLLQYAKSGCDATGGQSSASSLPSHQQAAPPYALRHLFRHLVKGLPATASLMDDVLKDYGLIGAIFDAGAGWGVAREVRAVKGSPNLTPFGRDGVRWLLQCAGALSVKEQGTVPIVEALKAPMDTLVFKEAREWYVRRFSDVCPWVPSNVLGGSKQWSACEMVLLGHSSIVTSVCFSPDGRTIVSGSDDYTLRVWDASSGECKATLSGHSHNVSSVCFSPDGRTIVSGSSDKTLRVWDASSGECKATLSGHSGRVTSVCFSPDGRTIVSGSYDETLRVWDASSGECKATLSGHSHNVSSVCFSPDGRTIVSGSSDKTLRVWDASSGDCKATLSGHSEVVTSVCFSPDGRTIVSGSWDNTLRVWDASSGECKATLSGHSDCVTSVCFSPDGRTIVSGSSDKTLRVWDASSGECKATLSGHSSLVTSVCFGPDGRTIVSGSWDETLRVWDASSGNCKATLSGHSGGVTSVCFSPDGRTIVSGSIDATLRVWDASSGDCKATLSGHSNLVTSVCFSPDGRTIVSGSIDATLRVWDASSGECKATLSGHSGGVTSVCFSPDGRTIVSGSDDYTLRVWDASSGDCKATLSGHSGRVTSVCFSPDGRTIVSGSDDKTLRVLMM